MDKSEVKVTKLPPGKAFGADDQQNWAQRRSADTAGVYDRKAARKQRKRAKELSTQARRRVKVFT
jgi:hypothetical protein